MSANIQTIETDIDDYVARYAFLLDMQSNAVVIVNRNADIIYVNPAFSELSGYAKSSITGQCMRSLLPRFRRVDSLINDSLSENKSIIFKDTLRHHSLDQILPLIFNINPLSRISGATPEGVLITIKEDSQQLIKFFDAETEKLSHRILALSVELRSKLKLINALFDNSPVGMMVLDEKCTIMQINPAGKKIFESTSSLIGTSCKRFYNVELSEFDKVDDLMIDPMEIQAVTETGKELTLLRCSVRSRDEEHLIYETFVDVSEIENARIAAEKANQSKSDFLANMTHELQTPLNIIMGYSQMGVMIRQDSSIDEVRDLFSKILASGEDLGSFISNILDISKAEAGKLLFCKQPELINPVVFQAVEECKVLCADKNITINLQLDENMGEYNLDRGRFRQVIRNIMTNAIKFSPPNSEINISGVRAVEYIEIKISDSGPGIPPDELEVVFSKFEQSSVNQAHSGGTGLGLAISREIISGHNGRIYAENQPQGGVAFIIRLPV